MANNGVLYFAARNSLKYARTRDATARVNRGKVYAVRNGMCPCQMAVKAASNN